MVVRRDENLPLGVVALSESDRPCRKGCARFEHALRGKSGAPLVPMRSDRRRCAAVAVVVFQLSSIILSRLLAADEMEYY